MFSCEQAIIDADYAVSELEKWRATESSTAGFMLDNVPQPKGPGVEEILMGLLSPREVTPENIADRKKRGDYFYSSLTLNYNDHHSSYEDAKEWWADEIERWGRSDSNWVSLEEKDKALDTDSVWMLQVYPNSPVGFNIYFASSLQALLEYVSKN